MRLMGATLLVAVGQLMAAAVVPGLPPPPPSTTAAPTEAPRLASPLAGDASPTSSSPTPRVSPVSSTTRLAVVSTRAASAAWPLSRTTPTPVSSLVLTPHPARRPPSRHGLRRYRTADVHRDRSPTTLASPTTLTSPTKVASPTTQSSPITPSSLAGVRPLTPTSLVSLSTTKTPAAAATTGVHLRDDRGGRAAWSAPTANAAPTEQDASGEQYYRRYYTGDVASGPGGTGGNTSWWSAVQTGLPILGQGLGGLGQGLGQGFSSALRRVSHHHVPHRPFVAAHWEDPDYGDSASGGSQVVAVGHPHPHPHQYPAHPPHQPVYYHVADQNKKEDTWSDLTTKLIILAVIKLLIVKALSVGAFKLFIIGLVKIPIAFAAFALKFAVVVKFFKFIKTAETIFLAVLVIPVILIAVVPLLLPILIPLGLLLIPLLLLPLLLLFPVPVLTPGGTGGGTVITITPGRRRREEEEQALAQLESRVADSRRCLQKMACDVGYRSQAVKGYADWVMWLMGLMKPILGEAKRNQLKGFMSAYKAGLGGRSCYRKYPCYANNLSSKRGKGAGRRTGGVGAALEGAAAGNRTVEAVGKSSRESDDGSGSSSASFEERIVYDPVNGNSTSIDS